MKLYRAMCEKEFQDTTRHNMLSWNSKYKWFGTKEFVFGRVKDGTFNNSKFVVGRYKHVVEFDFDPDSLEHLSNCGNNEFMLNVRKSPLVKIKTILEVK